MPKLRQLEYLVALDDHATFRKAAQAVGVSQPTLTQQVQALEARLGAQLVQRKSSPVSLTPIGREIVSRARRILLGIDEIRKFASEDSVGVAGIVRLGISATLGPYLMPEIVAGLHRDFPAMRLHLVEGMLDDQLPLLRRGALDLIIATGTVRSQDLETVALFDEPLRLVAAPDHPLALKSGLSCADLAGAKVLGLGSGHVLQHMIAEQCIHHSMELLADYQGSSLDSLCQMVASGMGIAILPDLYLRSAVGGRNVVQHLQVGGWSACRPVSAVWRADAGHKSHAEIAQRIRQTAQVL
ncbi:LysR family transcriptional regulator [Altericroceibacterium endophyticum]|nr:LysR substrate-binding domain-containing protein [Altericroceibacterium endophyticum]